MADDIKQVILEAIMSVSRQGQVKVTKAGQDVRTDWALKGRSGSGSLERVISEAMVAAFRPIAQEAVNRTREFDPAGASGHAEMVRERLVLMANALVSQRRQDVQLHDLTSDRQQVAVETLQTGMQEIIDDEIRSLKHQKLQNTGTGTFVAINSGGGHVNVAAGNDSRASQNIHYQTYNDVKSLLAEIRAIAQQLPELDKMAVIDHVTSVEDELAKPKPDHSRLKRIAGYLGDKAAGGAISGLAGQLLELVGKLI